jgi:hypothetical protein
MVCCKTGINPSTKLAIARNIRFFWGAFWLRFFNAKILKGYYIFWIVKKNGYTKKISSIRCQNPNVLVY